jgi:hypothetical protein
VEVEERFCETNRLDLWEEQIQRNFKGDDAKELENYEKEKETACFTPTVYYVSDKAPILEVAAGSCSGPAAGDTNPDKLFKLCPEWVSRRVADWLVPSDAG